MQIEITLLECYDAGARETMSFKRRNKTHKSPSSTLFCCSLCYVNVTSLKSDLSHAGGAEDKSGGLMQSYPPDLYTIGH